MIHGKDDTTFIVRDRPIRWQLQIGTGSTNKIDVFLSYYAFLNMKVPLETQDHFFVCCLGYDRKH